MKCKLLQHIGSICERWGLTEKQFRELLKLGFPARKIGGRWMAHEDNIDQFFRRLLIPAGAIGDDQK